MAKSAAIKELTKAVKSITTAEKEISKKATGKKRGRKGKGRKAIPEADKRAAKAAGYTSVKKWKEAGSPKPEKKKSSRPQKVSKRWEKVKKDQEREMRGEGSSTSRGPRRRKVGPDYLAEKFMVAEGVNAPALSKVKPPTKMSPAQRRRRVAQGLVGGPRAGRREQVRDIGEFSDTQAMVAERMGLGGRGMIDENEIMELGGFQIAKGGGQIKYKKKGGPIGVGAARAGFGKVRS